MNKASSTSPESEVRLPTAMIINGEKTGCENGEFFSTINPANGKKLIQIPKGGQREVDLAAEAARQAFDDGPWSRIDPSERKCILQRYANLVEHHSEELALLESLETGKPISDCRAIDLPETINILRWHAEAIDKIYDQMSPSGIHVVSMIIREPVGVVGAILPWNFPLIVAALKIGPCLAVGNTMILKPAELSSLSTIRLVELAKEAGIPDGVLNVVTGFGETAGMAIGMHPKVDCIGFTGSTEVGRLFLKYAASSNLKRVLLELGGKSPMVVMEDVSDLEKVADHATTAIFWNMGENCTANSRLLVHESIKDELLEHILRKTDEWIVGDPMDSATRLGPLIEKQHFEKVMNHIEGAVKDGANLVKGGNQVLKNSGGFFVEPTIFDKVSPDLRLSREEIFGPVLGVTEFSDINRAIQIANDTEYGLQASVFTSSQRSAHFLSRKIRAGTISVNCYTEGDMTTPFGGYKGSGFGGREKSMAAHDQYSELKTIWHDLS